MIVSTLSTYPQKKVVKDLGVVFAYDTAVRGIRLVMNMESYLDEAMQQIFLKAEQLGGNAVLGLCFDLRDTAKPVLMGTAVIMEDE